MAAPCGRRRSFFLDKPRRHEAHEGRGGKI